MPCVLISSLTSNPPNLLSPPCPFLALMPKGPHFQGGRNQAKLQTRLDELVKVDASRIKAEIKNCPSNIFTLSHKIEDDVIHRVVYSVYL
jgi:hypothetical protein